MRGFARIYNTLWSGSTGSAICRLGPEATAIAVYLFSNSHSNCLGLYHLRPAYVMADLSTDRWPRPLDVAAVRAVLHQLEEVGFCRYDDDSEYVWVLEAAQYQLLGPNKTQGVATDKALLGAASDFRQLPETPFTKEWLKRYDKALCISEILGRPRPTKKTKKTGEKTTKSKGHARPSEGSSKGLRRASVNGSVHVSPSLNTSIDLSSNESVSAGAEGGTVTDADLDLLDTIPAPAPAAKVHGGDILLRLYHECCPSLPKVMKFTPDRRAKGNARWRECPDEAQWRERLTAFERDPFYAGQGDTGWRATYDFIVKNERNALHALERQSNRRKVVPGRFGTPAEKQQAAMKQRLLDTVNRTDIAMQTFDLDAPKEQAR